jgi:uncharacterized coiled-coil protein SlyX
MPTAADKPQIDELAIMVIEAQNEVSQLQADVASLTQKLTGYHALMTQAQNSRSQACNNKALAGQIIQSALDLKNNSKIAHDEIVHANKETGELAEDFKMLTDKLIHATSVLNIFSNTIIRQKALNPLISDELISMVTQACSDANNAVALTLVALQSTFAAASSNIATEAVLVLTQTQAIDLYNTLTDGESADAPSVRSSLDQAYFNADVYYQQIAKSCHVIDQQLNTAQADLNKAQAKLASLQSGLAAAKPALASVSDFKAGPPAGN